MRGAMQREHKLSFRAYLRADTAFRRSIATELGRSEPDLDRIVDSLPPLEVYLPVRRHRSTWIGGPELLVAAALHEGENPVGFALDGTPARLLASAPPEQPVLVLTKVETDFEHRLDSRAWTNVDDANGLAVGTLARTNGLPGRKDLRAADGFLEHQRQRIAFRDARRDKTRILEPPCDTCNIDPPPPPVVLPPGIWLTSSYVRNYEEPWYRGTAEIQLVLVGPALNGFEGARLSCSGQYAATQAQNYATYKYFDQSGSTWSRKPSLYEGMLFGQADLDQFGALYQNNVPVSIELWEDDSGGANCSYDGGNAGNLDAFAHDIAGAYGVVSQIVQILSPTLGGPTIAVGMSLALSIAQLRTGGDDIRLGRAVNVRLANGTFSQTEYHLIRQVFAFGHYLGLEDNGTIAITIVQPAQ